MDLVTVIDHCQAGSFATPPGSKHLARVLCTAVAHGTGPCLQAGYAVVFLSRKGSNQPFVSDFQEDMGVQTLTDFFKLGADGQLGVNGGVQVGQLPELPAPAIGPRADSLSLSYQTGPGGSLLNAARIIV